MRHGFILFSKSTHQILPKHHMNLIFESHFTDLSHENKLSQRREADSYPN